MRRTYACFRRSTSRKQKKKGYSQADLVDLFAQKELKLLRKKSPNGRIRTREPSLYTNPDRLSILDIEDIYEAFLGENPFDYVMKNLKRRRKAKIIEFANLLRKSRKISST